MSSTPDIKACRIKARNIAACNITVAKILYGWRKSPVSFR